MTLQNKLDEWEIVLALGQWPLMGFNVFQFEASPTTQAEVYNFAMHLGGTIIRHRKFHGFQSSPAYIQWVQHGGSQINQENTC